MQFCVDDITVEIVKPQKKYSHDEDVKRVAMFIYTLGQIQNDIRLKEKKLCKHKTLEKL